MNNGFSIVQVQEWLGHSSPEITLRYYAHVDKTSKNAIASAINIADFENEKLIDAESRKLSEKSTNAKKSVKRVKLNVSTAKKRLKMPHQKY